MRGNHAAYIGTCFHFVPGFMLSRLVTQEEGPVRELTFLSYCQLTSSNVARSTAALSIFSRLSPPYSNVTMVETVEFIDYTEDEVRQREWLAQGRVLLGNRTPEVFLQLSAERQEKIYRRELIKTSPFIAGASDRDAEANEEIINNGLLRQARYMGTTEAAKHIVEEARKIFYTRNTFYVRIGDLRQFLWNKFATGEVDDVRGLIRNITIAIKILPSSSLSCEGLKDLELLSECKGVEMMHIHLEGGGTSEGSDFATVDTIRWIAHTVKALRTKFPGRVKVEKVMKFGENVVGRPRDLGKYWDDMGEQARARCQQGTAKFDDIMAQQVEVWSKITFFGKSKASSAGNK